MIGMCVLCVCVCVCSNFNRNIFLEKVIDKENWFSRGIDPLTHIITSTSEEREFKISDIFFILSRAFEKHYAVKNCAFIR